MAPCVLDASALLAFLYDEPGGEVVMPVIDGGLISSVNQSEVLQKNIARGKTNEDLFESLQAAGLTVVAFDARQAGLAAAFWPLIKSAGLSLADRACLALAKNLSLAAFTADRDWAKVSEALGVEVRIIR